MSLANQRKWQIGVNIVENIVLSGWNSRWQSLDSHNDDAIDGLIFLERGGELSGQIIFVQIKCMKIEVQKKNSRFAIPLSRNKLSRNLAAWRRVIGAAIVVLVDQDTLTARWVDIKPNDATSDTQIYIPAEQIFNASAKAKISLLCGTLHRDLQVNKIHSSSKEFDHLKSKTHIQKSSRELYQRLQNDIVLIGSDGPRVHFDRDGWRHITRPIRSQLVRYQSFALLGVAKKIIEAHDQVLDFRIKSDSQFGNIEIASISAVVSFPFRQTGLVKVLLKRSTTNAAPEESIKFWSIYEPRRKSNLLGVQEPRCL